MARRAAAILALLIGGSAWWGFTAAAGAGPPETLWTFTIDEEQVLAECQGFNVVDHVTGVMSVTVWSDKTGAPKRIVTENRGQHEFRNSATSVAVTSEFHRKFMTDIETGRTHVVGPAYHVTVPGAGNVLFETGTIKFENGALVRMAGQHDLMNGGLVHLCPAFA
jgi:hypothetical protein